MAKTRAQRKAERRAREAQEQQQAGGEPQQPQQPPEPQQRAQHDTQVPVSGDVAEVEAVEATGAQASAPQQSSVSPTIEPTPAAPGVEDEEAAVKPTRRQRAEEKRRLKAQEKERARRDKERDRAPAEKEERQRGVVLSFLASSWAELKRVQWPDRETLIQASAVTLVFVAIAAAYLGALDAAFSFLIKRIL